MGIFSYLHVIMTLPSTIMMGNKERMSRQVTPPGGWRFQQGSIIIRSENWNQLMTDIKNHRINNKMDAGDPEKEAEEQILILHPHLRIK